jgi:hypothetical protein
MENEDQNIIDQLDLNTEEQKGVEKFLEAVDFKSKDFRAVSEALEEKYYIPLDAEKKTLEQKTVLFNILQEFFSCFVVFGYDMSGNDMYYHFAPNSLTHTALDKKFQELSQQRAIQESGLFQILNQASDEDPEDYEDDEE